MRAGAAGHRGVPHTADLAVEAWGPDLGTCVAEAVLGAVAGFARIPAGLPRTVREARLPAGTPEQLLLAALEEVVFRAETAGELPAEVVVRPVGDDEGEDAVGGFRLRLAMVDSDLVRQTGSVPKAVSWHGLRVARDSTGWRCRVTLDV